MPLGFGLVSCERVPGDPRSWMDVYHEALQLTELADRLGFARVWTTEHHFVDSGYMPSVLVMSAAVAARTERIKIATGVLLAPLYHPLRLAEDSATVQLISEGRLELGLGLGWLPNEFEALGADTRTRGKAMDEIISILRASWSGEPIDHHGAVYDLPSVGVRPTPETPIPILIGGTADAAVRRAALLADGFFSNASPDVFKHQVEVAQSTFAEIGRNPESFQWHYYTFVYPCDDPERGWEEIRDHLWSIVWKYRDMGESAGRRGPIAGPPPLDAAMEQKLRARILLGTGTEIATRVKRLRADVGVDFEFSPRSYFPGLSFERQAALLERLAAEVLPAI